MKYFKKGKYNKISFINRNKSLIIILVSIIIVFTIYTIIKATTFRYEVIDYFKQDVKNQKIVFLFVKVNKLDINKIRTSAIQISKIQTQNINYEKAVVIVYFYKQRDLESIPLRMQAGLQKKYNNPNISDNLRFVPEGYIYMKFNSKRNTNSSYDTLMKSELIIPREGLKAKNVMKLRSR